MPTLPTSTPNYPVNQQKQDILLLLVTFPNMTQILNMYGSRVTAISFGCDWHAYMAVLHVTGRLHAAIVGPTGRPNNRDDQWDEAFTRSDHRPDSSARPKLPTTGRSNQSDRPVGQTVAIPVTSVNQISVAC